MIETTHPSKPSMRVLHLANRVGRASFGLGQVAMHLTKSQRTAGADAAIWSLDSEFEVLWAAESAVLPKDAFCTFAACGLGFLGYSPAMERAVTRDACRKYDILHQHGIWTALSRVTNYWRSGCGYPTVIAPHGSLEAWALKRSRWKKRLALKAYEWKNLSEATCLHALSLNEARSFRSFGLAGPIAVIPNGISDEWLSSVGDATSFRRKFGIAEEHRVMLFLSRITPKKGLPMFLEAMTRVRPLLEGWLLAIAGVDEFNHVAEVKAAVAECGLQDKVRFVGPLFDQEKRDAFAAAELFVLPSHSEGSPIVVLEALGAGVPVLATKASPWESLVERQCGWWADITRDALAHALESALMQQPAVLQAMGLRGKSLVETGFTWSKVAGSTLHLYKWLLGRASLPEFVITD